MDKFTSAEQKLNRQKWVKALRSGKYKQAKGYLRDGDAYCCLGVACDISNLGEWNGDCYVATDGEESTKVLPYSVAAWLGLPFRNGGLEDQDVSLASLNDGGRSFGHIAKVIENEFY